LPVRSAAIEIVPEAEVAP